MVMKKILLAGIAALAVSAAHADDVLPKNDPLSGNWCRVKDGVWTMSDVYERKSECSSSAGDALVIGQGGYHGDEVSCAFYEVKRLPTKDGYSASSECGEEHVSRNSKTEFRVVNGKLHFREVAAIEYDWSEPSCARVSDKLPVEPDGSYLNLRVGPGTEFKVKVKLPAGTDLNIDAVSQDGKWKHVRSAVIKGEIYSGWVREKFVLDQP